MSILEQLVQAAREDFMRRRSVLPEEHLHQQVAGLHETVSLRGALAGPDASFIAEIKRASPSAGDLNPSLDAAELAGSYEKAGAAAVSVLTEGSAFKGSLADLEHASAAVAIPVLRKDFIVDPYQVWEARVFGADAVLLVVAALSATVMVQLMGDCKAAGLEALVEVHDEDEMAIAAGCGAQLIGINARDLKTFEVDLTVCERLAASAPEGVILVAESGIKNREDVMRLQAAGFGAFLVGQSLVTAVDPAKRLEELAGI